MLRTFICQDDNLSRFRDKKLVLTAHGFTLLLKSSRKGHLYAKMIICLKQIWGKKKVLTAHSFMLLLKNSRNADLRAINMVHLIYLGLAVYL